VKEKVQSSLFKHNTEIVHGLSVVDTGTFFEFDKFNRTRGHILKMMKGRVATDVTQHFFTERFIDT